MKFILALLLITPAFGRSHLHEYKVNLDKKESSLSKPEDIKTSSVYDFFDKKADDLTKKKGLIRNYNLTIHNPNTTDDKDKKDNK